MITVRQPHELARRQSSNKMTYIRDADVDANPTVVDTERHKAQHGDVEADVPT